MDTGRVSIAAGNGTGERMHGGRRGRPWLRVACVRVVPRAAGPRATGPGSRPQAACMQMQPAGRRQRHAGLPEQGWPDGRATSHSD